ncbi:hypothetical protein QBC41DRAFT_115878 [Cercophora samala]|uniref:Uncharacterized protein n=1 Tax=Cercophora samala TaxID=330535 RepID=A0AA40DGL5_9PEZI|nr:hypothetical protein QBC41DRAFT_115878 [Cercophora samala]
MTNRYRSARGRMVIRPSRPSPTVTFLGGFLAIRTDKVTRFFGAWLVCVCVYVVSSANFLAFGDMTENQHGHGKARTRGSVSAPHIPKGLIICNHCPSSRGVIRCRAPPLYVREARPPNPSRYSFCWRPTLCHSGSQQETCFCVCLDESTLAGKRRAVPGSVYFWRRFWCVINLKQTTCSPPLHARLTEAAAKLGMRIGHCM